MTATDPTIRFWRHVKKAGPDECWIWTASCLASGHGQFRSGGTGSKMLKSHRYSYELLVHPIPDGIVLHHTCEIPQCVNPKHLVERTPTSHRAEHHKDFCKHGHDLNDPVNIYMFRGVRHCRTCRRMNDRRLLGIPPERWKVKDRPTDQHIKKEDQRC